ncbi:HAD-IA family hydrolase [Candidatus Dojkabacteria bacterium]|nr:HAD-IA family hydrolase [Candidatus Dojkabacteria bacterium]
MSDLKIDKAELLDDKQAYIFDMDGTLVNLEELNFRSYSKTLKEKFGSRLSGSDYQKYFAGTRTSYAIEKYLIKKSGQNKNDFDTAELTRQFRAKKGQELKDNFDANVKLIPGADEYLAELRSRGKKIGLATSSITEFMEIIIGNIGFDKYFEFKIAAEDVVKGKPDPEIYKLAVDKIKADSREIVVFEDSKSGIEAAKRANLLCVGVHTKGLNDDAVSLADFAIENYYDLL